jgi:hypothetical protein
MNRMKKRVLCNGRSAAGILTTGITEAGSLGARRTPKALRRLLLDKITA